MEFRIVYLTLFCPFLVIGSSEFVLVERFSQEYGVNVGVPKGIIYFVVRVFYCALMIFIMILFLILLFMLTKILS